jgi:hypothetical protein
MKKSIYYIFFMAVITLAMGGCAFMRGDAEVIISVEDHGNKHAGEKVYLYYAPASSSELSDPTRAEDVKTIEGDGTARFVIGTERFLVDDKRTLYFEMFDTHGYVFARKAITVTAGGRYMKSLIIGEIQ